MSPFSSSSSSSSGLLRFACAFECRGSLCAQFAGWREYVVATRRGTSLTDHRTTLHGTNRRFERRESWVFMIETETMGPSQDACLAFSELHHSCPLLLLRPPLTYWESSQRPALFADEDSPMIDIPHRGYVDGACRIAPPGVLSTFVHISSVRKGLRGARVGDPAKGLGTLRPHLQAIERDERLARACTSTVRVRLGTAIKLNHLPSTLVVISGQVTLESVWFGASFQV
ncbi:hypothetical protein J3R83DRAFT_7965 [Lanmaoa asiatica]|nr:hypothetical protein J3R83DRAFT_7965 [Lanmaoa asiatica]